MSGICKTGVCTSGICSFSLLLGRLLLSAFFIWSGLSKILHFNESAQFMAAHGLSSVYWVVVTACAIELLGGFSLLLGFWIRWGALLLLIYIGASTYFFYQFWSIEGAEMHVEKMVFIMYLAIMGGLFYVFGTGAGRFSFDHRCFHDHSCSK